MFCWFSCANVRCWKSSHLFRRVPQQRDKHEKTLTLISKDLCHPCWLIVIQLGWITVRQGSLRVRRVPNGSLLCILKLGLSILELIHLSAQNSVSHLRMMVSFVSAVRNTIIHLTLCMSCLRLKGKWIHECIWMHCAYVLGLLPFSDQQGGCFNMFQHQRQFPVKCDRVVGKVLFDQPGNPVTVGVAERFSLT